jgi:signal transduction histidine kinase
LQLITVYGLIELLLARGDTSLHDQRADLERIRDCGESIVALVSNATLFVKADAGVISIERCTCNYTCTKFFPDADAPHTDELHCSADGEIRIHDALDEILQNEKRAEETTTEILIDIADDVPLSVRGDLTYLKYILQQLLNNAIKFTMFGSITISVRVLEEPGQFVTLAFTVADTGGGFGMRRRDELITPFSGRMISDPRAFVLDYFAYYTSIPHSTLMVANGTLTVVDPVSVCQPATDLQDCFPKES